MIQVLKKVTLTTVFSLIIGAAFAENVQLHFEIDNNAKGKIYRKSHACQAGINHRTMIFDNTTKWIEGKLEGVIPMLDMNCQRVPFRFVGSISEDDGRQISGIYLAYPSLLKMKLTMQLTYKIKGKNEIIAHILHPDLTILNDLTFSEIMKKVLFAVMTQAQNSTGQYDVECETIKKSDLMSFDQFGSCKLEMLFEFAGNSVVSSATAAAVPQQMTSAVDLMTAAGSQPVNAGQSTAAATSATPSYMPPIPQKPSGDSKKADDDCKPQ